MKPFFLLLAITWTGLWFTPDQYGRLLFERGDNVKAAAAFADPMWRGVAWHRAGEFKKAAESFARVRTPEAQYNLGNAQVMLGQYDKAIANYELALTTRRDWKEALDNLAIAKARAKLVEQKGGDLGDQTLGADKIVFDKDKKSDGQETEVAGDKAITDASVQAMWLRQVQTKPADFLKAKFAYQQAQLSDDGGER